MLHSSLETFKSPIMQSLEQLDPIGPTMSVTLQGAHVSWDGQRARTTTNYCWNANSKFQYPHCQRILEQHQAESHKQEQRLCQAQSIPAHGGAAVCTHLLRVHTHGVYHHAVISLCFLWPLRFGLSPKTGSSSMSLRVSASTYVISRQRFHFSKQR